ncbi:MAG: hypothetical protein DLM66_00100 [Candidatus Dormiibacter spiritus]|nr:MAG: hypothetical protein DLM66_00100 [Candidatus Dormibacteraeota bacterium]
MADFSRPEYASYVQLCRELRLERTLTNGDWYYVEDGRVHVIVYKKSPYPASARAIWLPTLSDWLEMLEEAGITSVGFDRDDSKIWIVGEDDRPFPEARIGVASTREEAAARLSMAVRKPSAEPTDPAPESQS